MTTTTAMIIDLIFPSVPETFGTDDFREGGMPTELDRKQLIDCIDKEIERLDREHSRPGWTPWAILISLATVVSLFLAEVGALSLNVPRIASWFVVCNLGWDAWVVVKRSCECDWSSKPSNRRFRWGRSGNAPLRLFVLVDLLRAISVVVAASAEIVFRSPILFGVVILWYVLSAIGNAFTFLKSFEEKKQIQQNGLLLDSRTKRAVVAAIFCLLLALIAFPAIVIGVDLYKVDSELGGNARVAGLLFVIVYLLMLLYRVPESVESARELVRVRRQLAFDGADTQIAALEVRCWILGGEILELLSPHLKAASSELGSSKESIRIVEEKLSELASRVQAGISSEDELAGMADDIRKDTRDVIDSVNRALVALHEITAVIGENRLVPIDPHVSRSCSVQNCITSMSAATP